MKRVYCNEQYCVNCHLCEIHCIAAHFPTGDIIKAFSSAEGMGPVARLRVEEIRPKSFAVSCRHCDHPICADSCISGALTKDPLTGIVFNDPNKCVACWSCISVCPIGAPRKGYINGRSISIKCDLCYGKEIPACVGACPNQALTFEDRGEN
jgi:carbon-monoxide dehydrogenase iron sulfur subunit